MFKVGVLVKIAPGEDKGNASLAALLHPGAIGRIDKIILKNHGRSYCWITLKTVKGKLAINLDELKIIDSRIDYSVRKAKNVPENES